MDQVYTFNSLKGKRVPGPTKKGVLRERIIFPSIFEAKCSGLEQTVAVVESYSITVMAIYIRPSITVQTVC